MCKKQDINGARQIFCHASVRTKQLQLANVLHLIKT
jgi:hypothetical protein